MAYSISIAEVAENDIREAFLWYEEQKAVCLVSMSPKLLKAFKAIHLKLKSGTATPVFSYWKNSHTAFTSVSMKPKNMS